MSNKLLWSDIGVEQPKMGVNVLVLLEFVNGGRIVTGGYYSSGELVTLGEYSCAHYEIRLWMPLPDAAKNMIQ